MAEEFTPITSQEQLDGVLKDRLARKDAQREQAIAETVAKYADYEDLKGKSAKYEEQIAELKTSLDEAKAKQSAHEKEIADRDEKIKTFETSALKNKIAAEVGIPYEAVSYIQGEDEESIRSSAEGLRSLVGRQQVQATPLKNMETPPAEDGVLAAFRALNPNIKL